VRRKRRAAAGLPLANRDRKRRCL